MSTTPLFEGRQTSGTSIAIPVPVYAGCLGLHVAWNDATTAASFVLELSSFPQERAPFGIAELGFGGKGYTLSGTGVDLVKWPDSGQTVATLAAGAAGSFLINIQGVRQHRGRLRITATANCDWVIWDGIAIV